MIARANGVALLGLGAAGLWFAVEGDYGALMNPAFRWVTIAGSVLVLGMGCVATLRGGAGSASALVVFAGFFALVAVARPHEGGVAPRLGPPAGEAAPDREGYGRTSSRSLFESLAREARAVEERPVLMTGFVKRLPGLDARGEFVLLEPMMACCLADAVAFGLRVETGGGPLPADGAWMHVFGDLRRVDPPVAAPAFRVGALLFVSVSRTYALEAHEILPFRALLDDLYDRAPKRRCTTFRRLAEVAGLVAVLRGEASHTVFVPLDASFDALPRGDLDAVLADGAKARALVSSLIVRGRYAKRDLFGVDSLPTLGGGTLEVRAANGRILVGGARLLFADQEARNGVLHVVHPIPGR